MEGIYVKEFEVGISDVDKNNQMKLSAFLRIMQEVGALHSKKYGYCLDTEHETHKAWMVMGWEIEVLLKPKWNETLIVQTWIEKIDKIYFYRCFKIIDKKGNEILNAISQWIMVDTLTKKVQKIDKEISDKFIQMNLQNENWKMKKFSSKVLLDDSFEKIYECRVQKRDIDTNGHLNNVIYLDLALEGLSDELYNNINKIGIYYKSECQYNDKLLFIKSKNSIYIFDENKEKMHTVVILD